MTLNQFLTSSLGKKVVMAATGLFLVLFLFEHLYGNLLLYKGDGGAAFNEYSHSLSHNLLIRIIEVFLFLAIVVHVLQAVYLTKQNSNARPVKYFIHKTNETSNWFAQNMGITGSVIFAFIVIHLRTFFFPYRVTGETSDLAYSVQEAFSNGWYSFFYVLSMLFLAFHLNHGFQSAFRSLGLISKKYAPVIKITGTGIAILFFIGFASFPILFYFKIVTL
jgi:succinate dehydrogenase / fumarate reductase cytochrome b subunit